MKLPLPCLPLCLAAVAVALSVAASGCEAESTTCTANCSPADALAGDANSSDSTGGDSSGSTLPAGLTSLAKATAGDTEVEAFAAKPLAVGWQQVYYRVQVAGKAVTAAALVQKPLMKMMSMQHACPVVQPAPTADASGLFTGELLFQMASNASESWTLDLDITPAGGTLRTVALGKLTVAAAPYAKTVLVGSGMTAERYTVIVHFPAAPKVGLNPYRVAVHKVSADMLTFAPVTTATIKGTPEMPSMGHGSPNNVDPTHQAGGFYEGKLNLTMPGDWRLTLALSVDGKSIGNAVFDWNL